MMLFLAIYVWATISCAIMWITLDDPYGGYSTWSKVWTYVIFLLWPLIPILTFGSAIYNAIKGVLESTRR